MREDSLAFPVIYFGRDGTMGVASTADQLQTCTRVALKKGYFRGLRIVDSMSREFAVADAKKVGTVGPFFGLNIFLNQRIRVRLEFVDTPRQATPEELKALVLRYFKKWHGWESRGDLDSLQERVQEMRSVPEIIACLQQSTAPAA
jgi:hypothetical protein